MTAFLFPAGNPMSSAYSACFKRRREPLERSSLVARLSAARGLSVDEAAKTKLEAILKRDQEKRKAISEEQTKKKNEAEARQAKWYAHMTGTLIPGLKSIVEWLTRPGWMCQVEPDGKAL